MSQGVPVANIARMCQLAEEYLADTDLLTRASDKRSHANYLIQLTAFEILLKALRIAHGLAPLRNHSYDQLFDGLPVHVQHRLFDQAATRTGPLEGYSNPTKLLATYSRNFFALRYAYEPYDGMTSEQVREVGERWVAASAPLEGAEFVLYPEELVGLIAALRNLLKNHSG